MSFIPSVHLIVDKTGTNLYTAATLRTLMKKYGITETTPEKADVIWVSISHTDDLPTIKNARKIAGKRPLIMGGFESFFPVPYLAYADAICVGEGLEMIKEWGKHGYGALDLPCFLTREKYESNRTIYPSYEVPYKEAPLLKLPGKERYYYLAGRGCKGKCSFCATSWIQPHTECPAHLVEKVVSFVENKKGKINLISNDSESVRRSKSINAQSVRVRDYLKNPERYRASMLHFGIEFWEQDARTVNGKPISDDEIRALIEITKKYKQKCEFFFIVGYEGWCMESIERFSSILPIDTDLYPAIHVKGTYLEPTPHTPLAGIKIAPNFFDTKRALDILGSKNKRFRVFSTRSMARSAFAAVFHRATPEEVVLLGKAPTDTNNTNSFHQFYDELDRKGLVHLLERSRKLNEKLVKTNIR